ncbi:MAG: class III extradiol ring-cleavage dioxygenase [Sulfurospirillaceae bacterium]|nr:class III extradiol ring-cleavage dioxygenase [Sulfurospirillaceae bacterium]
MSALMPCLFVGHGSPMNLILDNRFTQALKTLSKELPKPKAILVISAHWYTHETCISFTHSQELIYDFYGFPQALYDIRYPAPSAYELAQKIAQKLGISIQERGLDHGAWMPLSFLYPTAAIPTIQLSINKNLSMEAHVKLGEQLQSLREEGVLILGSGNITHNLGRIDFQNMEAMPPQWAKNVDNFVDEAFRNNAIDSLTRIETLCPDFKTAHPSIDHYLPLLYIAGLVRKEDTITSILPFFQNGSLSMRGFLL